MEKRKLRISKGHKLQQLKGMERLLRKTGQISWSILRKQQVGHRNPCLPFSQQQSPMAPSRGPIYSVGSGRAVALESSAGLCRSICQTDSRPASAAETRRLIWCRRRRGWKCCFHQHKPLPDELNSRKGAPEAAGFLPPKCFFHLKSSPFRRGHLDRSPPKAVQHLLETEAVFSTLQKVYSSRHLWKLNVPLRKPGLPFNQQPSPVAASGTTFESGGVWGGVSKGCRALLAA